MKLEYLGHASFYITTETKIRILIDPYDPSLGYKSFNRSADYMVLTHGHEDHSYIASVYGRCRVIQASAGVQMLDGVRLRGIVADHDANGGTLRGKVVMVHLEADGIRLLHMGDFGQNSLTEEQLKEIESPDILILPVGGFLTMGPKEARVVLEQVKPRVAIPMHYLTAVLDRCVYPLVRVEEFTSKYPRVRRLKTSEVVLEAGKLPPPTEIWVMEHTY